MTVTDYAAFLPPAHTKELRAPESTWWPWRGCRVHIARRSNPDAAARVLVIHGGGGYSGALWPVACAAAGPGVEMLAPDLPLYGDTVHPDPAAVRYPDWVELLCDLVTAEKAADPRPLILFGASMGGLLAYETAARTGHVAAVAATCLLDVIDPHARSAATRFAWMGRHAPALLRVTGPLTARRRVPIRWLANMADMSCDPALSRLCSADPRGGGARVPLGFVASWLNYRHTPGPRYAGPPVTLLAPAADRWTPPELSMAFLQQISAPTKAVLLQGCGHFPIEEPGLTQLRDEVQNLIAAAVPGR